MFGGEEVKLFKRPRLDDNRYAFNGPSGEKRSINGPNKTSMSREPRGRNGKGVSKLLKEWIKFE